jgi:hypothetical protein
MEVQAREAFGDDLPEGCESLLFKLMDGKPPEKAFKKQGREKVYNFLVDNPFIETMLLDEVRSIL